MPTPYLSEFGKEKVKKVSRLPTEPPGRQVIFDDHGLGGANPAVNTPRPSRGTRIESCDFIVLIRDR